MIYPSSIASNFNIHNEVVPPGETWTGEGELVFYPDVIVTVFTDQPGKLYIEFASFKDFWDSSIEILVKENSHEFHKLIKGFRYFRVRFLNDSGQAQTYFRLYTTFGNFNLSTSFLNGPISPDSDSIVTRPTSYETALVRGQVVDHDPRRKFGRATGISGESDIIPGGGTYAGQSAGNEIETIEIISANSADDVAGNGMRRIRVIGLKSRTSTEYEFEDFDTTGAGTTTSTSTWWRINTAYGISYGSSDTNATNTGTITIRHSTTTANIFAVIQAGIGRTQIAVFTIPYGNIGLLNFAKIEMVKAAGASASADVSLRVRPDGQNGYNADGDGIVSTTSPYNFVESYPIQFPALTDIKMHVDSVSSASNVSGKMQFELIKI